MLDKKDRMRVVGRVYRHLIEIWDLKHTEENEVGKEVQVPKKLCELWADVNPIRGKEYLEAQKTVPEMQYKITTRYREGITPDMLVKWGERELNINSIIDISGREEHMELMCTERVKTDGRF